MATCASPPTAAVVEDGVDQRDGRLPALQPEALLADVLGVEELLEGLGRVEPVQDPPLLLGRQLGGDPFDVLLDPALLVGFLDVHVLDPDRPAVGVAEDAEDVPQTTSARDPASPLVRNSRSRSHTLSP